MRCAHVFRPVYKGAVLLCMKELRLSSVTSVLWSSKAQYSMLATEVGSFCSHTWPTAIQVFMWVGLVEYFWSMSTVPIDPTRQKGESVYKGYQKEQRHCPDVLLRKRSQKMALRKGQKPLPCEEPYSILPLPANHTQYTHTLVRIYHSQNWLCGPHLKGDPVDNKTGVPFGSGGNSLMWWHKG